MIHCFNYFTTILRTNVEIAVQINGKVKATLMVGLDETQDSVKEKAHAIKVIADLIFVMLFVL